MAKRKQEAAGMIMPPPWPDDRIHQMAIKLIRTGLELLEQDIYYPMAKPGPEPMADAATKTPDQP